MTFSKFFWQKNIFTRIY